MEINISSNNRSKSFITRYKDIVKQLQIVIYGNDYSSRKPKILLDENSNKQIRIKLPKIPYYLYNFNTSCNTSCKLEYKLEYEKYQKMRLYIYKIIQKCKKKGINIRINK